MFGRCICNTLIYEYVRSRGGQYFNSLAEEIKMKMKT